MICGIAKGLRFVKIIELSDKLKFKVETIFETIKIIKNLLIPLLFVLISYTLIGLNLFKGALENRCRKYIE